jgi:hypothetical protein
MSTAVARSKKANPLPVLYEEAKTAIAKSASVDECKEWADKAAALRVYAKQSKDKALERNAIRIRARAIEREGALIEERDRPKRGGRPKNGGSGTTVSKRQFAAQAGLSKDEQVTAQRVHRAAEHDRAAFEREVESDEPPTIKALAKQGVQPHPKATGLDKADMEAGRALWGLIKNAQRDAEKIEVERALRGMTTEEIKASVERADRLVRWLISTRTKMRERIRE